MLLQSMFSALTFLNYGYDDDFVDRLSYFYTSSFLIMMAVLVSFKQFGGRPLECWVPAVFTTSWEKYTEMYCWAQNTYWVPLTQHIPYDIQERRDREISYYQWVPFFLLIEASTFYFPCLVWRMMNGLSGVRLLDIMSLVKERSNIDPEYRGKTITALSRNIENALKYSHGSSSANHYTLHRFFKCFNVRYYESYMTGLYLISKGFYTINVMVNLFLINRFLQTDKTEVFGYQVLTSILSGYGWEENGNFPRVTLCDFEIRVLGNVQRYTVQCMLVINIFTEKIFILLWIWFAALSIITMFSFLYWCSISLKRTDRKRFLVRHLELTEEFHASQQPGKVNKFLDSYIKVDGVFVLRMVSVHGGVMYCTELIQALWERFLVSVHEDELKELVVLQPKSNCAKASIQSKDYQSFSNVKCYEFSESIRDQPEEIMTEAQRASTSQAVVVGLP